jgi:uncharacterized protein
MLMRCGLCVLALLLSGCSSIFMPYPNQMKEARAAVLEARPANALEQVQKQVLEDNPSLKLAETGRAYQLAHQPSESSLAFEKIIRQLREDSLQANIRMSQMLSQAGSMLTNDNALPYTFAPYETLLLYHYQALNYLSKNDVQNAFVALRQANNASKWLRQDQQEAVQALKQSKQQDQYQIDSTKYQEAFSTMDLMAEGVKSNFDNPVIDYLSALMYQSTADYTNAIVSLRHALEGTRHPLLQRKLAELAALSGNAQQIQLLQETYHLETVPVVSADAATVVILSEQNLLMPREEINLPILLAPLGQIQFFALPRYTGSIMPASPVQIKEKDQVLGETQSMFNIQAAAAHHLQEQMPFYITREVVRVIAKTVATHVLYQRQKGGVPVLGLAMQVISWATTHADLRSWLLLPQSLSLAEVHLSPGEHELSLVYAGRVQNVKINAAPGSIKIIWMQDMQDFHSLEVLSIKE